MEDRKNDLELLAQLRDGSAASYELLMRRYNRLLFRAARGIVADDAEAQDVVQEAYLSAFTSIASFRGDASLGTWLVRIVINQALQQQRKTGRLVFWDEDAPMEDSEMASRIDESKDAQRGESPETEAARHQLRKELEQAIDLLPPIYRCVFILRAVQELSVEETAAALAVSVDVVKTRYLRARGMLRSQLAGSSGVLLHAVHDFQGQWCDEVVRKVLASLRSQGVIRDQ